MKHRPTIEEPRKVVLVFTDEEYDTDSLWELLQEYHDSEALLAASLADRSCAPHAADASTSASAEEKKRADGLIAGHAYSLIRVVETAAGFRLVKLRNPWGKSVRKLGMGVWGCTEHRGSCRAAARPCKWQSLQVASISARPLSEDLSAILTDHPHRSSPPVILTDHPHRMPTFSLMQPAPRVWHRPLRVDWRVERRKPAVGAASSCPDGVVA